MADVAAELDAVRQMAGLMVTLDEDGKRRALWYLADLSGLSQRAAQPPQSQLQGQPIGQPGLPPGVRMPVHQRPPMPPPAS